MLVIFSRTLTLPRFAPPQRLTRLYERKLAVRAALKLALLHQAMTGER